MKALRNRKVLLGGAALACFVGIIAICSFFPFIIDPSRWQTSEFLSDELIVIAIVIFSTVCLMSIAQASNAMNPNSKIARARVRFGTSVERVFKGQNISAFSQWVRKVLQPRDVRTAKERTVQRAGVEDVSVLDLEESDLKALVSAPQKYGDRFYKAITKKQFQAIMRAKRMKFALVDPSYYLSCSKNSGDRTPTEQSATESRKKGALLTWSIASKIVVTVVVAMIFTSLVYDASTGVDAAKSWMKFASRMGSMASSSFMGYMIGCQTNDIDAYYIELKCLVHDEFFEDGSFKAKSQQEEAKEAFAERVREENQIKAIPLAKKPKKDLK